VRTSPLRRSGVDHTVLPANTSHLPLPHGSLEGTTTEWTVIARADEAYYSLNDPMRMKGWVGIVGWPTVDDLPIQMVTHQLQVRCRPVKVCWSETDVLPLSHPTNGYDYCLWWEVRCKKRDDMLWNEWQYLHSCVCTGELTDWSCWQPASVLRWQLTVACNRENPDQDSVLLSQLQAFQTQPFNSYNTHRNALTIKPGFHYPSTRAVSWWPMNSGAFFDTRVDGPSWRVTARELG